MSVWYDWSCQLILLFNLFFLLFMSSTALFCTIYGSYCTISTNIYLYLQYFQQKVFNFSKISGSQTDPQSTTSDFFLLIEYFEISNTFDKSWLSLPLLTCHVKMGFSHEREDSLVVWRKFQGCSLHALQFLLTRTKPFFCYGRTKPIVSNYQ